MVAPKGGEATAGALADKLQRMQFEDGRGLWPLPGWAVYYLRLGMAIGEQPFGNEPLTVIVSVPERSFAAVFIGTGIVLARAGRPDIEAMNKALIAQLEKLGPGAPVILRNENRKLVGKFFGFVTFRGERLIKIQTEKATWEYPSVRKAYRIEVTDKEDVKLPKRQKGKAYQEWSPLAKELLPEDLLNDFQKRTSAEVVFCGPKNRLLHEMESVTLGLADADGKAQSGKISDLLRPAGAGGRNAAYRTLLVPGGSGTAESRLASIKPFAYILDGAVTFQKLSEACRQRTQIAILDRTEAQYNFGVEEANRLYVEERAEGRPGLELPTPPRGIEIGVMRLTDQEDSEL